MSTHHFTVEGDHIVGSFKDFEADLLVEFIGQVRALLIERAADVGQSAAYADNTDDEPLAAMLDHLTRPLPPPVDEVLARLLPSGRRDNSQQAGDSAIEFRRFTEADLRDGKISDATVAEETLRRDAQFDAAAAQAFLRALNDVRLSLGARLDVTEQTAYPRRIKSEQDQALAIYFWTGAVQEQLLDAIIDLEESQA